MSKINIGYDDLLSGAAGTIEDYMEYRYDGEEEALNDLLATIDEPLGWRLECLQPNEIKYTNARAPIKARLIP